MSFEHSIYNDFELLQCKFEVSLKRRDYEFDYDLFIDSCIKCDKALSGKQLSNSEYMKYLWVAYLNELKRIKSKHIYMTSIDDLEDEDYNEDLCSEIYNETPDKLYNLLVESIREKFGDDITDAWISHICYDKSYKELTEKYPEMKFNFEFKQIKKYITTKLINKNQKLKELVSCLYD